jgi:hypothetical protein
VTVESGPIAGRYRLIREVGRGGMGAVFLAHDDLLGREVAIKRLGHLSGSQSHVPQSQARAHREAQLAARLSHPNVVTVFDLAEDGETRWLVMEYVEGTTLARLAADRHGLPRAEAASIIRQAAEALHVAHQAGIVHRDVKPSNLIVAPDGTTKLTDFGIARGTADETLTATGILTGSPAYLAPEVASGQPATPASDLWSLGATLYQAVTGRPPYDLGENVVAGLVRIVHDDPPRLPPDSGPLGTVLAATMVKDPARRWTAAQVCAFLDTSATAVPEETRVITAPIPAPPPAGPPPAAPPAAPAAPPVVSAALPPERTQALRPVTPRRPARRQALLWPLAGVLLLALAAGAWLLGRSGDPSAGPGAGATAPSARPTTPTPTTSAPPNGPTAQGMEQFVRSYLATVTRDPHEAFAMLTPSFQAASGGYDGYRSFWSTIASATPSDVRADPAEMTVSYHVEYVGSASNGKGRKEGRGAKGGKDALAPDDVVLRLVYDAGHYLIDGEPK